MRGNVVIAGIGQTAFGKLPGRSTISLNIEACRNALADAGVEKGAVDALLVKPPTSDPEFMYGSTLATAMGLQPRVGGSWDQGGAANISLISFAAMAIEHGQCEIALVSYADNPRTGSRHAYEKTWGDDAAYGWFGVPAGYAVDNVSFDVREGEIVSIIGPNGAGKTTLLRTIAGLVTPTRGSIVFDGNAIHGIPAHDIVGRGLAMVPEGGRLFPFMTVLENLELGAFNPGSRTALRATLDEVVALFPILGERRDQLAGSLSGGERQMCAIARALMSRPRLLMLDEPSAGLSPVMEEKVFELLRSVVTSRNVTVLLVEQHVEDALELADRAYVIERGSIVKAGTGVKLMRDPDVQRAYMGLS
jgi:branched-chain amino acid transport system ATP-binding protein